MANLATIQNNIIADSGIDDLDVLLGSGTINQLAWFSATGRNLTSSGNFYIDNTIGRLYSTSFLSSQDSFFGMGTGNDAYIRTENVASTSVGRRGLLLSNGASVAHKVYAGGNQVLGAYTESDFLMVIGTGYQGGGGTSETILFHSTGRGNMMALSALDNRAYMYLPFSVLGSELFVNGDLKFPGSSGGFNLMYYSSSRFYLLSYFDTLTIQGGVNDSNKRQIDFNTGATLSAYIDINGVLWKGPSSTAIAVNDNSLKFATTAYVQSQGYAKTGSANTFTATNTFDGTTAFNGAVDGYFNGDLYTFRYFVDGSGFIANQIISWDTGGNISLGNRVYALANYGLSKAALTTATLSVGNNFTSAGSSLFVKTGSLSTSFASGLGVDGSYSGGLSRINLHAIGTQSTGGYASAMSFILDNNGTSRTHMALDSDKVTRLYGTLDAFVPNADIAVGQFHRLAWNGISAFSVFLNSSSAFPFVYYRMPNGRLGINVDNPAVPLDVSLQSGANGQVIRMSRSAGAYTWAMGVDGNSFFSVYNNGGTVLFNINPDTGRNNAVGGITYAYGTHAIRTLAYNAASSVTIDLPSTFPEVALVGGNTWAVFARCNFFSSTGGVQVREFVIGRNAAGTWSTANYGPNSSTVDSLQSVSGSGGSITINMNSGTYLQLELTVMVR